MSNEAFRELLLLWQKWVYHDHSLHGLGIAQSAYAERIGTSYSASDPLRDYSPEVALWHEFFKTELPPSVRDPIHLAYLVPGLEKTKYEASKKAIYYTILGHSIETARHMFVRHLERETVV